MTRRKAERETDDARVNLRTLAAQLTREIDRLDVIVNRLHEGVKDGS